MTTQFARASYQEIIDLHTEEDTVSVIGIHTPQGDTPRKMFGGFFDQFKKFKYLGCSVSLVPAARLPADPSQVSYEAGEQYIDPRDMLNPLMFHGCHGNDMGVILNRFYNTNSIADIPQTDSTFYYADSITDITDGDHISGLQLEDLYYKALTDNTWKKAHPQRGFKKGGLRPLVYSMATNMQFSGGDSIGMDGFGIPEDTVDDVSTSGQSVTATFPVSQNGRRFFTPRLTGLGWLDTRNVLTTATTVIGTTADIRAMLGDAALAQQDASEADLPLVYMGMILLPPAYKTEQYFRMIVNHHFAFKDFRGISFSNNLVEPPAYNQLNDPDDRYYPGEGGSVDPPTPDPPGPIAGVYSVWVSNPVEFSLGSLPGGCYRNIKYGEPDTEPDATYADVSISGNDLAIVSLQDLPDGGDTNRFAVLRKVGANDKPMIWDDDGWHIVDITASTWATAIADSASSSAFSDWASSGAFSGSGTAVTTAGSAAAWAEEYLDALNSFSDGASEVTE